jgi:class 3 adenylate cyclase
MASTRRLAAILAVDVADYSRLMGADEEGTHERLKAHLVELVEPKIREHRGRIVKTTGDGVLAEFARVVDAVRCAGEIQRAMADRDLDLADERRLRFRIGVNLGDVIADGGDIYGDGVNIAVRLEGLAAPGGIRVSGTVRDHIGERIETPTKHWKITPEDIRNRARRRDYLAALDDMFERTSTTDVPWHVVPAEYKWFARLAVAKTVVKALGKGLALGPPPLDPEVVKAARERLDRKELAALGLAEPGQPSE